MMAAQQTINDEALVAAEPAQRRRLLFVLWDGGGNVAPQLALARRLAARGHHIRILAPRVLRERIEAAGCTFVPYTHAPEHDLSSPTHDLVKDWEARTPLGASTRVRDRLMFGTATAFADDVLAAIQADPVDVVVTDYVLLGAYVAAERVELPAVALVHSVYPFPAPGRPPFGFGFMPAHGRLGRLRDAAFTRLFTRFYNARLPMLNATRARFGLAPLGSLLDSLPRLDRILVLTSQAFDTPAWSPPANVRYVGPQLDDPAWFAPWSPPWGSGDNRPLVVVSLSTTFQNQGGVIRRVIAALAPLPVRALVTVGPALEEREFAAPAHVVVQRLAPHRRVLPQTDLVVTHGGHGTVITALAHGVPVLCLPMGRDQADIAARVVWHGAGRRLSRAAAPRTVGAAIMEMLGEPRLHAAAQQLATAIKQVERAQVAVAEVEALPRTVSRP